MATHLLINEPPLQVLPHLALTIGLNEAIVLQQVHYWLNPQFNQNFFEHKYWVFNTYEQWHQQFPFWSERTIQRITANLEQAGLLVSFVTGGFKKIKYYTIDYDRLNRVGSDSQTSQDCSPDDAQTLELPGFGASRQTVVLDTDTLSVSITPRCRPLLIPRLLLRFLQRLLFLL